CGATCCASAPTGGTAATGSARRARLLLLGTLAQVVDVERLDELLEDAQLFLVDLGTFDLLGFGSLVLVLEDHAGLVEHRILDVNRDFRADRERDGVGRTRVNLDVTSVGVEDQL